MKRSLVRRVTMLLLAVALIGWMFPLTALAEEQQGEGVSAKTDSQVAPSATQESAKAGTREPSAAAAPAAQGAGPATGQQPAKQTEEKREASKQSGGIAPESEPKAPPTYSTEAVVIAGLMIVVLGFLFFLQLSYSHRLEQTTYLGEVFRDSVLRFESDRLEIPHREKRDKHGYLQEAAENEPPPSLDTRVQQLDQKWGHGQLQFVRDRVINESLGLDPWNPGGGTTTNPYEASSTGYLLESRKPGGNEASPDNKDPEWLEYQQRVGDFRHSLQEWKQKITKNAHTAYENDLVQERLKAEEHTKRAINTTEASVLRGQGPQFVLEFTALIVIIFLALVLGVLGRLGNEQIGTLLAAMAGYVLGKSTAARSGTGVAKPTGQA
jgi:hypothetical protein